MVAPTKGHVRVEWSSILPETAANEKPVSRVNLIAATQQKLEAGDLLTFEEISLTSLQRFELMMQIEDQFSIELDEDEVEAINSVAATVEKIRTLQLNLSSV